jgi:hypothetical protein
MTPNLDQQIVTIAEIQRRARKAHAAGQSLEDCPLPPDSNAYATWAAEYARLSDPRAQGDDHIRCLKLALAHGFPQLQSAPAPRQRVEQAQVA